MRDIVEAIITPLSFQTGDDCCDNSDLASRIKPRQKWKSNGNQVNNCNDYYQIDRQFILC